MNGHAGCIVKHFENRLDATPPALAYQCPAHRSAVRSSKVKENKSTEAPPGGSFVRESRTSFLGLPPLSLSWLFSDEESARSPLPLGLSIVASSCCCAGRQFRQSHSSLSFSVPSHPHLLNFCLEEHGLRSFSASTPFWID
jgi:hypothetical protein